MTEDNHGDACGPGSRAPHDAAGASSPKASVPIAFELLFHSAIPGWAKVKGLRIKAVPECEGGGFMLPLRQARLIVSSTVGAIGEIVAERRRQVEVEGWSPEHDDSHSLGEMALAACSYAYEASRTEWQRTMDAGFAPPMWPWDASWWKPKSPRQDLVRAGALILAEIERLDRAQWIEAEGEDPEGLRSREPGPKDAP